MFTPEEQYENFLHDELTHVLLVGRLEALLTILIQVGKAANLEQIEGLSFEQFYLKRADERADLHLSHFADANHNLGSALKRLFDKRPKTTSLDL